MTAPDHPDIICLAHLPWDGPWKAYHQIVSRLAANHRVLCVDPPSGLRAALREAARPRRRRPVLQRLSETMALYRPPWWLARPQHHAAERLIEPLRVRHAIWTARRHDFKPAILWVFEPWMAPYVDWFHPDMVVYHVVDDYVEYLRPSEVRRRAEMRRQHEALLRRADIVFAVSPGLTERCRRVNPATYLVPNGVDYDRFQAARRDAAVPDDLRAIPKPIIGYIGSLEPKLDLDTVRYIAGAHPEWSLVFIGPAWPTVADDLAGVVRQHPNVHYLGPKAPPLVPHYMKALDVAMLADRERTDGDSLKLYEYLACGLPVVALEASGVDRGRHLVDVARTPDEFIRYVETALADNGEQSSSRMAYARQQTWDRRAGQIQAVLARHLSTQAPSDARASAQRPHDILSEV